jgi:hypothetical protein
LKAKTMGNDEMEVKSASLADEGMSPEKMDGLDVTANGVVIDHGLHRALKQRHMHMIALGGVIGYGPVLMYSREIGLLTLRAEQVYGMEPALPYHIPDRYGLWHGSLSCMKTTNPLIQ